MDPKRNDGELLAQYISTQDPKFRDEIILRYIPLVHFVLGRLGIAQSMGADYEDAASQGLLGLIEAVDRYDLKYGAQFSTYATLRIRGKVIDYLRSLDWLSRSARKRARLVQNGMTELWEKLQRAPSDRELATHLNLELPMVQRALVDSSHIFLSLDSIITAQGEDDASLHELLPDENQNDPAQVVEEEQQKESLIEIIKSLPEREQLIISLYYHDELTFKEIGLILGISESRVCQLHGRIVTKMKVLMTKYLHSAECESRLPAVKKPGSRGAAYPERKSAPTGDRPAPALSLSG